MTGESLLRRLRYTMRPHYCPFCEYHFSNGDGRAFSCSLCEERILGEKLHLLPHEYGDTPYLANTGFHNHISVCRRCAEINHESATVRHLLESLRR